MLAVYDLKNQRMLNHPDFWELVTGFDSFYGVSFVSSFKIIENEMNASGDNYEKLAKLQKQLNEVNTQYDEKTARWEYLSNYVD